MAVALGGGATLTLRVPPGALRQDVAVTITPSDPGTDGYMRVRIKPAGLVFLQPAELTLRLPENAIIRPRAAFTFGSPAVVAVQTQQVGSTLTATISALGLSQHPAIHSADPAAASLRGELAAPSASTSQDETQVDAAVVNVQMRIQLFLQAIQALEAQARFAEALRLRMTTAALAQLIGEDAGAGEILAEGKTSACQQLEARNGIARHGLSADFTTLWRVLEPVLAWAAAAEFLGVTPADCQALSDLADVLGGLIGEFIDLYAAAMQRPTFRQQVSAVERELYRALRARSQLELLGASGLRDRMVQEVQIPLAQRIRGASYRWCRTDLEQAHLGRLFRYVRDGEMALASPDDHPESVLPDDVAATAADLLQDIQYCGTAVAWRQRTADGFIAEHGMLGGDSVPGAVTAIDTVRALPHGMIELDSTLVALRCANEQIGDDRIFVEFNTVVVRELTRVAPTAHFIRLVPYSFPVDTLIRVAGVNPEQPGLYPLTLIRESSHCGNEYQLAGSLNRSTLVRLFVRLPALRISIDPFEADVRTGETLQFSTAVHGGEPHTPVQWSAARGSISGTGLYTAPASPGADTVVVRVTADPLVADTAFVTVTGGGQVLLRFTYAEVRSFASAAGAEPCSRETNSNLLGDTIHTSYEESLPCAAAGTNSQNNPLSATNRTAASFSGGTGGAQLEWVATYSSESAASGAQPFVEGNAGSNGGGYLFLDFEITGGSMRYSLSGSLSGESEVGSWSTVLASRGSASATLYDFSNGTNILDQYAGYHRGTALGPENVELQSAGILPPGRYRITIGAGAEAQSAFFSTAGAAADHGSGNATVRLTITQPE